MHPYLNTAIKAARLAGNLILRYMEQPSKLSVYAKGQNDLVTQADQDCERIIIETIRKAYPDHGILGEESGFDAGNEFTWVIDPIDGTHNFVHGFPQFCISIALKQKGYLEHGVIFDPLNQDLYTASKGAGAQLNSRRIRVSEREGLQNAFIGTALPSNPRGDRIADPEAELHFLHTLLKHGAEFRKIGSAALNLAYVASGKLDGFFEANLGEWDIAAGALIVREAGGFVGDFKGENGFLESGNIIAGTRKVYTELLQTIQGV